jgi:4-hydroxybenzoate polyprenyltransferase
VPAALSFRTAHRWWTYQRERFPVFRYGALTAVFVSAAMAYSARLRCGAAPLLVPFAPAALIVAFACVFLFFLEMRIADEFKDREDDARYRPYRPVPRGLIELRELGGLGVSAALAQLALVLWFDAALLPFLIGVWGYLALMTSEFFAREWLRARPVAYLLSHMLNIPLITLFATAFDWRAARQPLPPGLLWLPATAFFVCLGLETGRKIRAAADEEQGVETYSFLWGHRRAVEVWTGVLVAGGACAWAAAGRIGAAAPVGFAGVALAASAAVLGVRFVRNPAQGRGRAFERFSEIFALVLLACLGPFQTVTAFFRR